MSQTLHVNFGSWTDDQQQINNILLILRELGVINYKTYYDSKQGGSSVFIPGCYGMSDIGTTGELE